ncbi:hypothetical protein [Armatimonas sp.]|uniref:hypothetical protein n=1 Tax=Armatimonas sp. TaxID=1872638 RepID=UPI0037503CC8
MTNGDVLAYISVILTILVTLWATILAVGLVFTAKTQHAAQRLEQAPGRAIGVGIGLALGGIGLGVMLLNSKNGLFMLIGWVLLALTLCLAMVGSAGLARVVSARMQSMSPTQSALALLARSGALLIAAGALPAVGWVLLFPLQLFASLGAGFQALTARERRAYEQPVVQAQAQTNPQ